MIDECLADFIVVVHAAFLVFVVFGGFLVLCRRQWAWLHIPAVVWSAFVELAGSICPLTHLENYFRARGGEKPYGSDFIEHYVMPVLYPEILTRRHQIILGVSAITINLAVYTWLHYRQHRRP